MKKINLRELYPDVYTTDFFVDVTEEVMETIRAAERAEAAYERKMYRYKAQYSLDCENGIENAVLLKPQTPEMLLEEKQFQEQVYTAVMKLPEKQAKLSGWEKAARMDSLGEGYGLEDLRAVLLGKKAHTPRKKTVTQAEPPKVNLLEYAVLEEKAVVATTYHNELSAQIKATVRLWQP